MKKILIRMLLVAAAVGVIVGCKTSPVYNVDNASVVVNKNITLDQMKTAIIRAGAKRGWAMKAVAPGHVVGTLHQRQHMAQIDIKYNTQNYSITYKDSSGLNYDGTNIHNFYNKWIQTLRRDIDVQLSML
ncbi:MAG: hypothetical protein R6X15_08790 [Pseudomonadota bacterium]